MTITNQLKNQHLLWRAGFGPKAGDMAEHHATSQEALFSMMVKASAGQAPSLDVADNYLKALVMGMEEKGRRPGMDMSDEDKRKARRLNRDDIKNLNLAWLNEMVDSDSQLREKMALFWHGHFACRNMNIFYQQLLLDVIRRHALGNFGDLLREVSKTAAMLNFLNNNQNRKGHPNENFAREVMELFTMGRGNYSESDIREGARAFTGWGANVKGDFVFRQVLHDNGAKNFLGRTGNFTGDDVLTILLENRATAAFISRKLYRYFVNETVDEKKVAWLAGRFFTSGYDISALLKDVFTSDWFYDPGNIGARIKSPVELLVGMRRMLPMKFDNEEVQLLVQRVLGQMLFYPPNVAGWPGGTNWIDSSSLMFRMRLPQMIKDDEEITIKPKEDDDLNMGMKENADGKTEMNGAAYRRGRGQQIKASINWQAYTKSFEGVPRGKLVQQVSTLLLQTPGAVNEKLLLKYADASSKESFIKTVTIELMSSPEYQLC